ncbi:MAG: MBL fold metallo-hydrolase [Roseovarius sp.]
MPLTRRAFMAGASALPLATGFAKPLIAEMALGDALLTTVSDGHLTIPAEFTFGPMPAEALAPIRQEFGLTADQLEPECNLALWRDGTNTVLFDVGSGPDFMPTAGSVLASLDMAGVSADEITHVVFTHAHPDHIWGLLDEFDEPAFPEATYMMGRAEWDYWWNPETVNTIGEARMAFAVGAKRRMEAIEESVMLFGPDEEILPGIASVATPGHTPGHMSFELRNGSTSAMVVGDAIGNHHVAFRKPGWQSGSDQDADLAIESRVMLFDRIVSAQMPIVGFHLPGGGMGRVETADEGFRFIGEAS